VLCEELLPIVFLESDNSRFFVIFFIKGDDIHFSKKDFSLLVPLPVVFLNLLLLTLSVKHHKMISKVTAF